MGGISSPLPLGKGEAAQQTHPKKFFANTFINFSENFKF